MLSMPHSMASDQLPESRKPAKSSVIPSLLSMALTEPQEEVFKYSKYLCNQSSSTTGSCAEPNEYCPDCIVRQYAFGRIIGNGSFGVVAQAHNLETGERVAIKKVHQDPRYKNRELSVMKELNHPNIITLKDFFYTESRSEDSSETYVFLNVVMDHVPDTVYRVLRTFVRNDHALPMVLVRLYTYQLCRSIGYLHSLKICHRDIKPQNLLVDTETHILKLCDFGSAKRLVQTEQSVAYICSRFYRAPELMLGTTQYSTAIDIWSVGCVLGELLLGRPLFFGETSVDQLVKIIQVLGTPTPKQMQAMNPSYQKFQFPNVSPVSWRHIMRSAVGGGKDIPDEAISLLDSFLRYDPSERLPLLKALTHPFFDPLRDKNCKLCDSVPIPDIMQFTPQELAQMTPEEKEILIPQWYIEKKKSEKAAE